MLSWLRKLLRGERRAVRPRVASRSAPPGPTSIARPTEKPASSPAVVPPPTATAEPVRSAGSVEPVVSPGGAAVDVLPLAGPEAPPPDPRVELAVAALTTHFESSPPRLGAFPGTASRIMQVFGEGEPDFNRVVHELQQDAAVVTRLLNVANSAFFGGTGTVDDIRGAVLRIGMHDVSQIALAVAGQSLFEASSRDAFSLLPAKWNELFHTSMSAAFATSWLSQFARVGRSDQAFLTGLLHDVGQPIALRGLVQLVIDGALDRGVLEVVDAIIDEVHVDLGRSVTALSGLPDYLCAAASLHHDAEVPVGPERAELHLVRIIDGIAAQRRGPVSPAQQDALTRSAAALSLDPRWNHVAATEYESLAAQVTRMFGIADPFAAIAAAAASAQR
jgi:HD-like signal output (HDOD) protein